MKTLDISQVAAALDLPASTLRYYEQRGLIAPIGRRGLKRLYAASVIERLQLIAAGRAAGFSLEELSRMLAADGAAAIDRTEMLAKSEDLDRSIRRLSALRDGLRHAVQCRHEDPLSCTKFQRLLNIAGKRYQARP